MHVALVGAEHQEDLTVRYLWGALEAAGHEVTHVVFNDVEDLERAARQLVETHAPLAGLSMVFTSRAAEMALLAERARQLGYRGHITSGGHFAAFNAEALLRDVEAIDSAVVGEGEAAICQLASSLVELDAIPGLVFRAHDGAVLRNGPADKPRDLDTLPWPVHMKPYHEYLGVPIASLLGSRGCSYRCHFCSITSWHRMCGGAVLRMRAPERVAEEIAALWADGVRIFNFTDDNFILPNRRLMLERLDRLERALSERGVGRIAFATKARPDEIDEEMLGRLKDLGLFRLFLGIEAGTARSLAQLGRTQCHEDNERALAICNEMGVHACFNLLLWNPDSRLEDIALNVEWLREHHDNPMNFSRTEVYAGTPLLQQLEATGRLLGDYWGYDYRVADERAERAFQLAYAAFRERNFGPTSAHHLTMRVDYELHLLEHFFGAQDALRREVKDFVRAVNLDTCEHLSEILRACDEGTPDEAFEAHVVDLVQRGDIALGRRGQHLLSKLARAVAPARDARTGPYARRARAAALVAALSLGACGESGEAPDEVVQAPAPTAPEPPPAVVAPAEPMQPLEEPEETVVPEPPGDPEAIRSQFDQRALRHLRRGIRPARETRVELQLADDGTVTEVEVSAEGLDDDAAAEIGSRIASIVFRGADVVGRRFVLTISASQLRVRPSGNVDPINRNVDVIAHPTDRGNWHIAEAAHNPNLDLRRVDPSLE